MDFGLWEGPQELLSSLGRGLLGLLHGDGRRLDEVGPGKKQPVGVCFLGFLYILKIVCLSQGTQCAPNSNKRDNEAGNIFENLLYFGDRYRGLEEVGGDEKGLEELEEDLEGLEEVGD